MRREWAKAGEILAEVEPITIRERVEWGVLRSLAAQPPERRISYAVGAHTTKERQTSRCAVVEANERITAPDRARWQLREHGRPASAACRAQIRDAEGTAVSQAPSAGR